MIEFIKQNYPWIFSGIGVFFISLFFLRKGIMNNRSKRINQKISKNSSGIQAGRDINIENK